MSGSQNHSGKAAAFVANTNASAATATAARASTYPSRLSSASSAKLSVPSLPYSHPQLATKTAETTRFSSTYLYACRICRTVVPTTSSV